MHELMNNFSHWCTASNLEFSNAFLNIFHRFFSNKKSRLNNKTTVISFEFKHNLYKLLTLSWKRHIHFLCLHGCISPSWQRVSWQNKSTHQGMQCVFSSLFRPITKSMWIPACNETNLQAYRYSVKRKGCQRDNFVNQWLQAEDD